MKSRVYTVEKKGKGIVFYSGKPELNLSFLVQFYGSGYYRARERYFENGHIIQDRKGSWQYLKKEKEKSKTSW